LKARGIDVPPASGRAFTLVGCENMLAAMRQAAKSRNRKENE
jgi:hypothetical protein